MSIDVEVAAWVARQVPHGRRVVHARRLTGGLTSEVTAVTVEDASARLHRLVLRRWTGKPWPDGSVDDGGELVPREAAVLEWLEPTSVPAPRLVATDAGAAETGLPALLMTRVPGRIDLDPTAPQEWTRQLAEQLLAIHEHAPASWLSAAESPANLDVDVPPTSDRRDLWERAIEVVAVRPPQPPACFVHQDYQQFNVLWSRGRLVGVVDWVWAAHGPADADVAHCRLNLCLLYGAERAIAFQTAYESLAGRRVDPWWDVAGVVDYLRGWSAAELRKQAGRRLRIDGGTFPAKVETLLEWVLRRAT